MCFILYIYFEITNIIYYGESLEYSSFSFDNFAYVNVLGSIGIYQYIEGSEIIEEEDEPITPTVLWSISNKTVQSLHIGQKEIQTIERVSDGVVLYQKSDEPIPINYNLTVSLSNNLIYTDGSTIISGTLTANGSAMSNEIITIYDDYSNTSLGTCTTDSNGAYSKTLSGFDDGIYTLKASHTNVDSSTIDLAVLKHIYIIRTSANPSTITSGQSSVITATLTKDNNAYSNQTVTFSYGGNSYTSTTDSNGVATHTYTGTGAGSITITASSNGASNSVTITDNPSGSSTPTSISVSATKDTLSAYHNETSTLTATVLDNNDNPVSGQTVTFKNGSTTLGTDTTDSNGEAEYTYTATGVSDITITAECDLLSDTYTLEDCIYAHLPQIDTPRNNSTYHYLNNDVISNLPSTYKIEFDMKSSTAPANGNEQRIYWSPSSLWTNSGQPSEAVFVGYNNQSGTIKLEGGKRLSGRTDATTSKTVTPTDWSNIRIEKINDNSAFYIYHNEDYYTWWTLNNAKNYSTWVFGFALWSDTTFSIKNIKIKPL